MLMGTDFETAICMAAKGYDSYVISQSREGSMTEAVNLKNEIKKYAGKLNAKFIADFPEEDEEGEKPRKKKAANGSAANNADTDGMGDTDGMRDGAAGVTPQDKPKRRGGGKRRTDAARIEELYNAGMIQAEIAREMGISPSTVSVYLEEMRLRKAEEGAKIVP